LNKQKPSLRGIHTSAEVLSESKLKKKEKEKEKDTSN
jgi:hypothetical protein